MYLKIIAEDGRMFECSIIIRTKNEEENIGHCIKAIKNQTIKKTEVILVDNFSTDNTVKIAKSLGIKKILFIKNYKPGLALNIGIKESNSENIAIISAHCFPKNNKWLHYGLKSLNEDEFIAGVYGKQLPVNFTNNSDFRDMFITFGDDRKIQIKDSFFHNANSFIKKKIWNKYKFDNNASNIEDRIWAKNILKYNYKIIYEPSSIVFHPHGIHQNNVESRLNSTIKILKKIEKFNPKNLIPKYIKDKDFKVVCICTGFNRSDKRFFNFIKNKNLSFVNIFVSVSNENILISKNNDFKKINKPKNLQKNSSSLKELLIWINKFFEKDKYFADYFLYIDLNYKNINTLRIKNMYLNTIFSNYDSSTFVTESYKDFLYFNLKTNEYDFLNPNLYNKVDKSPFFIANYGLGTITKPKIIRNGMLVNTNSCRIEVI